MEIVLTIIGCLIVISSEILPFIKSIKSNGIIDLFVNFIKGLFNKKIENSDEITPLLVDSNNTDIDTHRNRELKINIAENSTLPEETIDMNYHDTDFVILNTINNLCLNLCKVSNKVDELISKLTELQQR